jgi:predicted branched-subunit amino acid permease
VGAVYAVAVTVFGGSTQFIITGLIKWTGQPLAPAYYMMVATVIGIIAMVMMQETVERPSRAP